MVSSELEFYDEKQTNKNNNNKKHYLHNTLFTHAYFYICNVRLSTSIKKKISALNILNAPTYQ